MPIDIASAAYQKAADIFLIITHPTAKSIIAQLNISERTSAELITGEFPISAIRKQLQKLISVEVVRKEQLGTEVYYKLSHGRIDVLNAAAARLL